MLRALVESAPRFELSPSGYGPVGIRWVVDLSGGPAGAELLAFKKNDLTKTAPVRRDRTSGIRSSLLVDKASYALGVTKRKTVDNGSDEHAAFKEVLRCCLEETHEPGIAAALDFLDHHWGKDSRLLEQVIAKIDADDVVAFRSEASHYAFETASLREFWREYLRKHYSGEQAYCCVCGRRSPILPTLPWKVEIFGIYKCALSSFNKSAFTSFGKEQTANSPLCFECASTASQVLQYLVDQRHHRHWRVLSRDESRGEGKTPLKNQLAIFWLKEVPKLALGELTFDIEAALAGPITDVSQGPPPDPAHVDALYGLPWHESASALQIATNRFYLGVLSPNKSRLVVREWVDTSLDAVCRVLKEYDTARALVSVDGLSVNRASLQEMLGAVRPWKSRSATDNANIVRKLVRTAYTGTPPPPELLHLAVQRFRVPIRPKRNEIEQFERWRQAQATAIKLVLTYGTEEAITLQTIGIEGRSGPHLCGQLLAILEEAQSRASRWRINATLVDRFYGGASTSPSTTLGHLMKQFTQAHMPKIRKNGLGYGELEETIESVWQELDRSGGWPATLTLSQQGEFALGFYLRRAAFRAARPKPPSANIGGSAIDAATTGTENNNERTEQTLLRPEQTA